MTLISNVRINVLKIIFKFGEIITLREVNQVWPTKFIFYLNNLVAPLEAFLEMDKHSRETLEHKTKLKTTVTIKF